MPVPIGILVDGVHFTIEEILVWAKSQNLLDEEKVKTEAVTIWFARKGTVWENRQNGAVEDYYQAEKKCALRAFLNDKFW